MWNSSLFSVNSSVLPSSSWSFSFVLLLSLKYGDHPRVFPPQRGFQQTSPSDGSTVCLSGLSEGGVGAEEACPRRTPTTGRSGGFILALEHCDLYFLLRCWLEGVILHPAPSLGLLTSHITHFLWKGNLRFYLGGKLWFATVHLTHWRRRMGRNFSEVRLCRMEFKSLPRAAPQLTPTLGTC